MIVEPPAGIERVVSSKIVYCFSVVKINDHGKHQPRFIVLTDNDFNSVKKNFIGKFLLRRRVPHDLVSGFVHSADRHQCIVKFANSFPNDYRYETEDVTELMERLLELKPLLPVWTLEISLLQVTRTKYEKKNKGLMDVYQMEKDENFRRRSSNRV